MQKRDVTMISIVITFSLFLIFCFCFHLFRWNDGLTSFLGTVLVRILAWSNLMDYHSHIGGHHAHLHAFVWWINLLTSLMYAGAISHLANKKMKRKGKLSFAFILIFLISFSVYVITTSSFLFELERFAYPFFVPQV